MLLGLRQNWIQFSKLSKTFYINFRTSTTMAATDLEVNKTAFPFEVSCLVVSIELVLGLIRTHSLESNLGISVTEVRIAYCKL